MTDIVERLREHSSYIRAFTEEGMSEIERQSMNAMADAAVEISILRERTEIAEQRAVAAERVKDSEIALRVAAIDTITKLRAEVESLTLLLSRYRKETPLGHQPHMIAHIADETIARARAELGEGERP